MRFYYYNTKADFKVKIILKIFYIFEAIYRSGDTLFFGALHDRHGSFAAVMA